MNANRAKIPVNTVVNDTLSKGMSYYIPSLKIQTGATAADGTVEVASLPTELVKNTDYRVEVNTDASGNENLLITFLKEQNAALVLTYQVTVDTSSASVGNFSNNVSIGDAVITPAETHISFTRSAIRSSSGHGGLADTTLIRITKVDEANSALKLEGAVFQLLDSGGNEIGRATSNGSGILTFYGLDANTTYTLHELTAPTGYKLAADISITTGADGSKTERTVSDEQLDGTLQFVKTSSVGGLVKGAQFGIWEVASVSADIPDTAPLQTVTSGTDGRVTFTGLRGSSIKYYKVKEISAPSNFIMSTNIYVAQIAVNGAVTEFYLEGDTSKSLVTSVVNTYVPPVGQNPPDDGHGGDDPGDPSPDKSYVPDTPTVVTRMPTYSPEAIAAWNAAQLSLVKTKKLPQTGGFVGSALLFLLGGGLVGCGVYLGKGNSHLSKKHEKKSESKSGLKTRIAGRRKHDGE